MPDTPETPPLPTPESPVPVADAVKAAPDWQEQIEATEAPAPHRCSNGHECSCPDIPAGGHACGRSPEFEPDGPVQAAPIETAAPAEGDVGL